MISFEKALARLHEASDKAHAAMAKDYPIHAVITYKLGAGLQIVATVIGHGIGLRVKVRGNNSGKEYWIDARRISSVLGQSVKRR